MELEIWKDIPEFEGYYQISNFGRVKSLERKDSIGRRVNSKIMKPTKDSNGYMGVSLFINNKRHSKHVHVLVAMAFLGHRPCGQDIVVDHKDRNTENNRLENLQLVTHKVNISKDKKILDKGLSKIHETIFLGTVIRVIYNPSDLTHYNTYKLVKL